MLALDIDRQRWEQHQRSVVAETPGLVAVAKGNGYGFGLGLLAEQCAALGLQTIAVGIAEEVEPVRAAGWVGDIVVLNPWRPNDPLATSYLADPSVISTISRITDLDALASSAARVLVEVQTSMRRHGIAPNELASIKDFGKLTLEGWTVHLPVSGSIAEANQLATAALAVTHAPIWFSHLAVKDYRDLQAKLPVATHLRVGTRLWLGTKDALSYRATILDVHPIKKGESYGYHQSRAPKDGFIVVASGGTSHGVALSAPATMHTWRQRAAAFAQGVLEAANKTRSPFTIAGKKRDFAEPPHMHASLLFVPGTDPLVSVGDEIPVTCRNTTVQVDQIRWS